MAAGARTLNIAMLGAGRMGHEIMDAIAADPELRLVAVWSRKPLHLAGEVLVSNDLGVALANADVAVDFSLPQATHRVLDAVLQSGTPLVIGVSGLDDGLLCRIATAAESVPVLYDRNMSVGIAVLDRLVRLAVAGLGSGFEAEIHETHHIHKIDAPSGTALKLGEAVAEARNQDFEAVGRYEPGGLKRPLKPGEIGFEVRREGEVAGEHTVVLYSESERLELKHAVSSRRVFAIGALRAAKWLVAQKAGLYGMKDLLFRELAQPHSLE